MSSSSSEIESDTETEIPSRLGDCEVCGANEAKYTCPKCEVKTCCLNCVRIHRKELECDGIRDRTKFIRMKDFTDTDLLSDSRLLEECARFVYAVKRDEKKKFTRIDKELPIHMFKLKVAARNRGTVLQFLAKNFTRNLINTTRYHFKTNTIFWRVEWVFPNVDNEPLKFVDDKCPENARLSQLLDKYINPDALAFEGSKALTYYKSAGFNGVKVLLRAEKVKSSAKKFFEMDLTETLTENLSGKCIIEFPIIFIVLKDHAYNLEIITNEDQFHAKDGRNTNKNVEQKPATGYNNVDNTTNEITLTNEASTNLPKYNANGPHRKRPKLLLTEKIAQEKKEEIEKEIKEERKKRPKNLLFTTGYSSEEDIVDSDSDIEQNTVKN